MAIAGIGTDMVRVARFRRFLEEGKTALLERLFTSAEREYAFSKRDPAPHLAARFAAKESFSKALGTGFRDGLSWKEIEVVHDPLGKPELVLTGRAAEILGERGFSSLQLSLSHDGEYATAVVVAEKER
ncbi:MAG: holo-ACP synthase [Desulfuromonadaceae bacterium]|nr:holo-ACP synthase [Desulfuromonadaceae bacterium]